MATKNTETTGKKRGPRGPHPVYYLCMAIKKVKGEPTIVSDMVKVSQPENQEEAEKAFKAQHNLNATTVYGPIRKANLAAQPAKRRKTITVSAKEAIWSGDRFEGVYEGWKVYGMGLKGFTSKEGNFNDNEVLDLLFDDKPLVEGTPKPRFGSKRAFVRASDIQDLAKVAN